MNKTEVAREVRDELYAAEAAIEAALTQARKVVERGTAARAELGLNGTMGDAALASAKATVAALEEARAAMIDAHQESYRVLKSTHIRGVASMPTMFAGEEEARVA